MSKEFDMVSNELTPKEQETFNLLVQGHSNAEIADRMACAEKTVKTYVTSIFKKTGCESRAKLIVRHYQNTL